MPDSPQKTLKQVIESLLFASSTPLSLGRLQKLTQDLESNVSLIRSVIAELQHEYSDRAFTLEEIGGGYLLRSRSEYGEWIQRLDPKRPPRLSKAAKEVLAIICYRQPVTRPVIEAIRGVDSSTPLAILLDRGLIESKGKLEGPGRPTLYGTTSELLQRLGLKNLRALKKHVTPPRPSISKA